MKDFQFLIDQNRDAVVDVPDIRDLKFNETFGAPTVELPRKVYLNHTRAQNQNEINIPSTKYACVFYTADHIINEQNYIESPADYIEIPAPAIAKIAYEKKYLTLDSGAPIQCGPKLAIQLGYTAGYTNPSTVFDVKQALYMRQLVQFGTRAIDWKKTFKHPHHLIVIGTCYGHSMTIEGYDDDLLGGVFIIRNSMGEFAPFLGRQFLRYQDLDAMFPSKYAYVDKGNADAVAVALKKQRLATATERGYWNAQHPNDFATRYEAAQVAKRITKFLGVNIPENQLWNQKDKNKNVSIFEVQAMFERASGKKFGFFLGLPNNHITRSDMVALSVRI